MCGRLACTLNPRELQRSCRQSRRRYQKKNKQIEKKSPGDKADGDSKKSSCTEDKIKKEHLEDSIELEEKFSVAETELNIKLESTNDDDLLEPEWIDPDVKNLEYKVNHNVSPTQVVPCLLRQEKKTVIVPMLWGFIPISHKGTATDHGLSTFNARAEGLQTSPLFKHAFQNGKRCAVLCTGFYEWKTIDGKKQPFLFHLPQESGILMDEYCKDEEGAEFHGPRITPLAGIYHYWTNTKGEKVPNVTIITTSSGKWMSWCHHRVPVLLDTPEKIEKWIDLELSASEAATMCVEPYTLNWYPVKREFYSAKPDHPLQAIRLSSTQLVPEFVTEWDKFNPDKNVSPPEPGKYKTNLKRCASPSNDMGSPSKKQTSLHKWFIKKENK